MPLSLPRRCVVAARGFVVCGLWFVGGWWLVVVVCWWLGLLLIQLQQKKGHFLTLRNIKEVGEGI